MRGLFAVPIHTMKHIFTRPPAVGLPSLRPAGERSQGHRAGLEVSRLSAWRRSPCWGRAARRNSTIVFFYEDFANGFAGNSGYGALTVEDSPDVTIWQYVDALATDTSRTRLLLAFSRPQVNSAPTSAPSTARPRTTAG